MDQGKCTVIKSGKELELLIKEKIEGKLLDQLKELVFARIPSSRVKEYVDGINVGFKLSAQSPDLKLLQVEYIYDSLLFDITNRSESDVFESVKGITDVKRYTEVQATKMLLTRVKNTVKEPWVPDNAKALLGLPYEQFFEAYAKIEAHSWIPKAFKEVRSMLRHPDVTPEMWAKVQSIAKVHE